MIVSSFFSVVVTLRFLFCFCWVSVLVGGAVSGYLLLGLFRVKSDCGSSGCLRELFMGLVCFVGCFGFSVGFLSFSDVV